MAAHRRSRFPLAAVAAILLVAVATPPEAAAAVAAAVHGDHGMAVTPDARASAIAVDAMREGGTAVDGAVAAAFALAVTYPLAGNLGGGGFLLVRTAQGQAFALDFRETAPAALTADRFLDDDGRPLTDLSLRGGLAVGVPGSVAGLAEAHRRWGRRPWKALIQPAIRLAREGVEIPPFLARALAARADLLDSDPAARRIYTRDGRPLVAGERLVQLELARTLERIAADGAEAFYHGPVAEAIAATVRRRGGVMGPDDLADYRPIVREPLVGSYRGHRILAFPPPSSGGVALLQILGMLERFDLASEGPGSSLNVHRVVEAERRAYADRARWLGDPEFAEVPVIGLLAPDYLAGRSATIDEAHATPSSEVAAGTPRPPAEARETLHLSVADAAGGVVALTTTLNGAFGTGLVAGQTGVLLNNEIDDFALAPGTPNQWGLLGGEANAVAPRKRPLSSMSPTIVESADGHGRPLLVLGSPGGATIITSVVQVVIDVIDYGMSLQQAVDYPRFHHQWYPDRILHERLAFPADVRRNLESRGHRLELEPFALGNVNAIASDPGGGWLGAADPRRQGRAAGY